jgi:DNA-directed RNA polymerase I subunit RPA2
MVINNNDKAMHPCPSYINNHQPTTEQIEYFRSLAAPHVDSFGYFLKHGLQKGIQDIEPIELDFIDPVIVSDDNRAGRPTNYDNVPTIRFWIEDIKISKPVRNHTRNIHSNLLKTTFKDKDTVRLLPRECRERGIMYAGTIHAKICCEISHRRHGEEVKSEVFRMLKTFGNMPIMVRSTGCHLENMSVEELIENKEEVRKIFR